MEVPRTRFLEIAIVEDCLSDLEFIQSVIDDDVMVLQEFHFSLRGFRSGEALLDYMDKGYTPSICFLGIGLPGLSGIELATQLRQFSENIQFIFISHQLDFPFDATFNVLGENFTYYTMPISYFEVKSALYSAASSWKASETAKAFRTHLAIEKLLMENFKLTMNRRLELALERLREDFDSELVFCSFLSQDFVSKSVQRRNLFAGNSDKIENFQAEIESISFQEGSSIEIWDSGALLFVTCLHNETPAPRLGVLLNKPSEKYPKDLIVLSLEAVLVTLTHEIKQSHVGISLHNFNIEIDDCLDQDNLDKAIHDSLKTLNRYTQSPKILIYHTRWSDSDSQTLLCTTWNENTVENHVWDIGQVEWDLLEDDEDRANAILHKYLPMDFFVQRKLVDYQKRTIGKVFMETLDPKKVGYLPKAFLNSFAIKIDSRICALNALQSSLERQYDPSIASLILQDPNNSTIILRPKSKVITMVHADLVGFSEICTNIDAMIISNIIYDFIFLGRKVFAKFGGIFDKSVGDCIIALVGPPLYKQIPYENTLNGLKISHELIGMCRNLNEKYRDKLFVNGKKFELNLSVGINTGNVVVGDMGPNGVGGFTALGHEMNLAARVVEYAQPGQILTSQNSYKIIQGSGKSPSEVGFSLTPAGGFKPKNMPKEKVYEARYIQENG